MPKKRKRRMPGKKPKGRHGLPSGSSGAGPWAGHSRAEKKQARRKRKR